MRAKSNAVLEGVHVNIEINGEAWTRVGSLKDSKPEDRHYVVKTKQSGETIIIFGDGKNGRRPPPGSEITASYRDSVGASGKTSRKRLKISFICSRRGVKSLSLTLIKI